MPSLETDESGPALPCDRLATARAPERVSMMIISISDGSNDDYINIDDDDRLAATRAPEDCDDAEVWDDFICQGCQLDDDHICQG